MDGKLNTLSLAGGVCITSRLQGLDQSLAACRHISLSQNMLNMGFSYYLFGLDELFHDSS